MDLCCLVAALPLPEVELLWRWGAADGSSYRQLLLERLLLPLLEDPDQRVQQAAAAALVRCVSQPALCRSPALGHWRGMAVSRVS